VRGTLTDFDALSLFEVQPGLPPHLEQALRDLAEAVTSLSGFNTEPDLLPIAQAVQDVLEAAEHEGAALAAGRWAAFEMHGRQRLEKEAAWLRCDALFRLDREAVKVGGWKRLAEQRPEIEDPSLPLLPLK